MPCGSWQKGSKMSDREFLKWLAARLVRVHHEHPCADFIIHLKEIIQRTPKDQVTRSGDCAETEVV